MGASGTDVGTSGIEVLAVAAPAAAVLAVTKPGVGASAAVAGASGATASGITAPEVPTSTGTPSVVRGVELEPVGVDEPATPSSAACCGKPGLAPELAPDEAGAAEELPGREALANEEKLFSKKRSTGNKGSERKNTYPEAPGFQRPLRLGDRCCRGGGGAGSCCCGGGGGTRSSCNRCCSCCCGAGGGGGVVRC